MTTISRRRFLALPAMALMQPGWPDRAQETPEPMTPEILTSWVTVLRYVTANHGQRLLKLEGCVDCKPFTPPAKGTV